MEALGKWFQLPVLRNCWRAIGHPTPQVRFLDELCRRFHSDSVSLLPAHDVWTQSSQIGRLTALDRLAG